MFSKFKIEKPEYVLYKRGRAHFEAERSVVSLPLLEAYDNHFVKAELKDKRKRKLSMIFE